MKSSGKELSSCAPRLGRVSPLPALADHGARGTTRPTFTADAVGRVAPRAPRTSQTRRHSWLRWYFQNAPPRIAGPQSAIALLALVTLAAAQSGWAQQASPRPATTNRVVPARVLRTVAARPAEPAPGGAATNVAAQIPAPPAPATTGPTNTTDASISSTDPLVRDLLKLQFDRRPASVLKAMARKAEGDKAFTNDIERFQADVIASDWPAVGKFLATLSQKQLPPVYKALITAGRMTDAAAFLPGFDASKEQNDWAALDLRAQLLLAEGQEKQDTSALRRSWELTQTILADKSAPATNREAALQRAIELMPLLAKELGRDWLRQNFKKSPGEAMSILAAIGSVVSQGANERDLEKRRRNLDLQRRVVDELLATIGPQTDSWQPALTVVALGWLQEADRAKARYRPRTMNQQIIDFDAFGNPIYSYYSPYDSPGYPGAPQADGQALSLDQLLPTAPGETWLAAMEKSVALRVRAMMADLHIKLEQEEKALPWIESLAADQPKTAVTLANDLLKSWSLTKDPNRDSRRNQRIYYGPYGNSYSQGIPITRAVQVRNLQQLAEVLARLRKLGPLDEKAVVSAFAASHSQAEVFRVADIEKVLGPPDELKVETLAELLQA